MLGRWPVRRWFRVLWCLLTLGCLGALPWIIVEFSRAHFSVQYQGTFIAGVFTILAIPVTIYEVAMHLEYFSRPKLQIRVIRILWMVPIYALDSWLALRFTNTRIYFDTVRECYEAYVIYNFFMYLLAYLEDEYGDVDAYFSTKQDVPHIWGLHHAMDPWPMGAQFFWQCKKGVLAYVILRPTMSAVAFLGTWLGKGGYGEFRFDRTYLYTVVVSNISQGWALYCLVLFYMATHDELAPIRPVSKFLVVKAVVFLTYWQGVAISILVWVGVIQSKDWRYDADDVASGLQEFLICVEMFFAALAHAHAFPPRDYMDPAVAPPRGFKRALRVMFDVRDVRDDMVEFSTDTVQETRERLTRGGREAWTRAKAGGERVLEGPKTLLALFGGRRRSGWEAGFLDEHDNASEDGQGSAYSAPAVEGVPEWRMAQLPRDGEAAPLEGRAASAPSKT